MAKLTHVVGALAVCAILVSGSALAADAQKKGEVELISGEVVSLWNYLSRDERGADFVAHSVRIIEKGLPVAILSEDGQLYIATLEGGQSAVKKLVPLMGMKVNAQGPVYRKNGTNLIEIKIVSEQ